MIYRLGFDVESRTRLAKVTRLRFEDYLIELVPNDSALLAFISIGREVKEYDPYLPKVDGAGSQAMSIDIPRNPWDDNIIELAQYIEGAGGFWFGIRQISWSSPQIEWVPQNDVERKKILINNFKVNRDYEKTPVDFRPDVFVGLLKKREDFGDLMIPLSFIREATRDYDSHRYLNAFIGFYFVIEDLFANGKFKTRDVEDEFKSSPVLLKAISDTINSFENPEWKNHSDKLDELVARYHVSRSAEGVAALLVKTRGDLLHFSQKSKRLKGHPLNNIDFHTHAFLLMSICIKVYVELCNSRGLFRHA